jgi:hypothetical protein
LLAIAVSEDCGGTASVRTLTLDATSVAGAPEEDTGLALEDAAAEVDCAGAALLV